ncbi:MAG: DUF1643 domain-containing protein [Desulfobacteraceae bacterium]|nr:DUF1643 domain-containing protein [Desulfobacteraceae bacterium]
MLDFLPAGTLKKKFGVFGHFYSIDLVSGEQIDCRSVLEIVTKKDKPSDVNLLLARPADAVFIMMNPGSSLPLEEVNNNICEKQMGHLCRTLVLTKPDTTQYQVMRVMHYCGWSHVRVLNLSDLRNPKSGEFVARYRDIEDRTGFTAHSMFSDGRNSELVSNMNRKSQSPIVCAWGVNPDLDPLIERCLSKVARGANHIGLLKQSTKNKYFHPLPTLQKAKMEWVNNMVSLINS